MSAWPQAVWIIREIQKQFNLNERVLFLQNRYYIFAPIDTAARETTGKLQPQLPQGYEDIKFSDDSMWFIGVNDSNDPSHITERNITGISLYHSETDPQTGEVQQGWSDPLNFAFTGEEMVFTPGESTAENFDQLHSVTDALNFLSKKITQLGAFVQRQYTIPENGWTASTSSEGGFIHTLTSDQYDNYDFGETPTIALSSGVSDYSRDIKNFNYIDYVNVNTNNRTYTFHATSQPDRQLVLLISKY